MNHDLPLVYHLYMTPDQQSDFHSWATNEQKFEVTNTIGTARLDALQKKKDAEWKAIRAEIDKGDYNHNLGQYGSADPDACKREFFHEENVGTTGYVPRHVLPIPTRPMRKACNERTDHSGIVSIKQELLPKPELLNKYDWVFATALSYNLLKDLADELSSGIAEGATKFSEQCFLIDNIEYMQPNPHEYKNFAQVAGGDPKEFLNKLISKQGMGGFVNATPEQLSGLVPYIKMWKVLYGSDTDKGREIPLIFKNNLGNDFDKLMTNKYGRGDGVGIKSFEWNLAGTNAVEASKLIESTLVLYFQDINALERNGGKNVSFLDLIYRNPKHIKTDKKGEDCAPISIWNEKYYRMKIQVGWSTEGSLRGLDLKKTFFLTLIDHQINFKDNGTIELTLRMQSQIEGLLSSPRNDILLMDRNKDLVKLENELGCFIASVSEENKTKKDKAKKRTKERIEKDEEKRKKKIKELKDKIKGGRAENYRAFLEKIEKNNSIHYIDVPKDDIRNWNFSYLYREDKPEDFDEFMDKRKAYSTKSGGSLTAGFVDMTAVKAAEKKAKEEGKDPPPEDTGTYITKGGGLGGEYTLASGGNVRIQYVHLGSILNAALGVHNENPKKLHELRNIIGNIELKREDETAPTVFSLADIPISLDEFTNWYYDECISQDKSGWNLSAFLKRITGFIVRTLKSDCIIGSRTVVGRPRVELRPLYLTLFSDGACRMTGQKSVDDFNQHDRLINGTSPFPSTRWMSNQKSNPDGVGFSSTRLGNYLVLSVYNVNRSGRLSQPLAKGQRRSARDSGWGIYHFKIGKDRGLLKNISFRKMDDPHLEAARYIEEGDTLGGMVRRYNATVDMYGNNLFEPGSEIFLDTSRGADVNSMSHKLGLGGYYMVNSVKSFIGPGEFTTSLDCIYVSSGKGKESENKPVTRVRAATPKNPTPKKVSAPPTKKSSPKQKEVEKAAPLHSPRDDAPLPGQSVAAGPD